MKGSWQELVAVGGWQLGQRRRTGQALRIGNLLLCLLPTACCQLLLSGCTRDGQFQPVSMWNQSRVKPYEGDILPDSPSSARDLPAGTVAVGEPWRGDPLVTGRSGGKLMKTFPIRVTPEVVQRGQERFNIYCSPCHGRLGDGEGMIVKRSFPHPPDYAIARLRKAAVGHFYDVMTHGYGIMYPYADRVTTGDRWAIAAYIRVLQKIRPEVPADKYEAERIQARERAGVQVPPREEGR